MTACRPTCTRPAQPSPKIQTRRGGRADDSLPFVRDLETICAKKFRNPGNFTRRRRRAHWARRNASFTLSRPTDGAPTRPRNPSIPHDRNSPRPAGQLPDIQSPRAPERPRSTPTLASARTASSLWIALAHPFHVPVSSRARMSAPTMDHPIRSTVVKRAIHLTVPDAFTSA
jgi:hypothetical protein